MESSFIPGNGFEGHVTTFHVLRFDAIDCIKHTWPFDRSNVSDDVYESISSFPKIFVALTSTNKINESSEIQSELRLASSAASGSNLCSVTCSGLQLIQSAYSDSGSASSSPSPSPGKRRRLSNGSISPNSAIKNTTNGLSYGNVPLPSVSLLDHLSSKSSLDSREKPVKLTLLPKQSGPLFLPRSLDLNSQKNVFSEKDEKSLKSSICSVESSSSKLVSGKPNNGVAPLSRSGLNKNGIQPSTSGMQSSSLSLPNQSFSKKESVVNGYSNPLRQNGSPLQTKFLNGTLRTERKRVLSERGEAAAKFPVIDRQNLMMTWRDSRIFKSSNRNCGVGLHNYSNDCFLNAVLQTMLHTPPLARYVAEQHNSALCSVNNCFVCALGTHMRHAVSTNNPFKPNWIQPFLRKIFPAHIPGYQEDAHELFNLLLDALDPPTSTKQMNSSAHSSNHMIDTRPSTPIEQIFGGTLRNQIRCTECMEIFINYERIRELNLGLRMRKRDVSTLAMDDLLSDYFATETFGQYECKKCRRKTQAQRSTRVLRAPNVLLIQLKRFTSFGSKIRTPVNMELNLRLDRFMYQSGDSCLYQLNAVIEHMGGGVDHGHYVAMVRGFDGKTWHLFDDEESRPISLSALHQRQAYLMVYTKREIKSLLTNGTNEKLRDSRPKAASYDA